MSAYLATLPSECPDNLAVRGQADQELAAASLHRWKVDLLRRELDVLKSHPPAAIDDEWGEQELRWATCMKMSRAFAGMGSGPVMMPFIDLANHEASRPSCSEQGRWVNEAAGEWVAEVIALRDLEPGDEITYPYSESPSKARMLTSFGFADGALSASLGAAELPAREHAFLAEHGCLGPPRTDLTLDVAPQHGVASFTPSFTPKALRAAVRCIRLRLYDPDEAVWALESGHLEAPWGGKPNIERLRDAPDAARIGGLLSAVLRKDMRICANTAALCRRALSDEQRTLLLQRAQAASADLGAAIREEVAALAACARQYEEAEAQIHARGHELFGSS